MISQIVNTNKLLVYPYLEYKGSSLSQNIAVIYLHGSGDGGKEFEHIKRWSLPSVIEKTGENKFHTLCPLCPSTERWNAKKVHEFIQNLKQDVLKNKKVILTGYSMGATGIYDYQSLFPNFIDSLIVVGGRTNQINIENLSMVPILAFYGESDERLSVSNIKGLKKDIENKGGKMELIVYPLKDHYMANEAYSDARYFEFLERRNAV